MAAPGLAMALQLSALERGLVQAQVRVLAQVESALPEAADQQTPSVLATRSPRLRHRKLQATDH